MKTEGLLNGLRASIAMAAIGLLAQSSALAQAIATAQASASANPVPTTLTIAFGGTNSSTGAGAVYTVSLGGNPLHFTNTSPTLVNSNPDQWSTPQVVAGLAFAYNSTSHYFDLIGSNYNTGDTYNLAGPGFGSATQLAGPADCTTFPASVAAGTTTNFVGVGYYGCGPADAYIFAYTSYYGWSRLDDLTTNWSAGNAADVVIAQGNFGLAQTGDAFVLIGDSYAGSSGKAVIVRYPAAAISSLCDGICGQAVVTQAGLFPAVYGPNNPVVPVSLDVSPVDGSLFVGTSDGSLWQLPYVPASGQIPAGYGTPVLYACLGKYVSGACVPSSGVSWGRIRAVAQGNRAHIIATVPNAGGGTIGYVGLWANTGSLPIQGASQGVDNISNFQPLGLALPTYKSGSANASTCIATPQNPLPNCDPLGDGVVKITIRGNTGQIPANATITEQECVVANDPRMVNGIFNGQTLPLRAVCPGLSDSSIIPAYVHGDPGFVVVTSLADLIAQYSNGIEVRTDFNSGAVQANAPLCTGSPANVEVYGSNDQSPYETTFVEGNFLHEDTGACDPPVALHPHRSVEIGGLVTDLTMFAPNGTPLQRAVGFADFKLGNLTATINQTAVRYAWEKSVLLGATAVAKRLVDVGHYDCAAEALYLLDQFVRRHRADFLSNVTATVREPNGFGDITGRIANLYLTVENTILGKTITWADWPLAADPRLCRTTECKSSGIDK
jgi:hypothetical protein